MWKRAVLVPIVVLAIAAILFFVIRSHWTSAVSDSVVQRTDDAAVKADQIPLSTRISGTVRRLNARDYQPVKAGQLLVEIDDADYQAAVSEARAALGAARAEYAANQNAKHTADASVLGAEAGVQQANAAVAAAQAGVAAAQASVGQAENEYRRQQSLLAHRAATREQFEQAQAARDSAQAGLEAKRADLLRARAAAASSESLLTGAQEQRAALNAKDAGLLAQIDARKAAVTIAQVNLDYTKIAAPADGIVGEFQVHAGQLVAAGSQIVPLVRSGVWVAANYQETQLARMRRGDPVDISIDALPGHRFRGRVAEIAPASGSQFAFLPPDNATGNYTKIVQRVPVKIAFDANQPTDQLRPGFSAEVAVHTSNGSPEAATVSAVEPGR